MGPNYNTTVSDLLSKDRANNIIFSSRILKINRFKKQTDRLLVISEKKVYKIDGAKNKVNIKAQNSRSP